MSTIKGDFGAPQQPDIDMSKTNEINCEVCLNDTFEQTLLLRKLSAILSPTNQETIIPSAVFACQKCGHVNAEFKQSQMDV